VTDHPAYCGFGNFPSRSVADAVRLLLLTGARRGELLAATWDQFDIAARTWVKPAALVKAKREHRVPLSAPAMAILSEMRERAPNGANGGQSSPFLFPASTKSGRLNDFHRSWAAICKAAGIAGLRIHDLWHSFASELVSAGFSLLLIGQLLGHSEVATTARYSHLYDEAQRIAVERVGARISNGGAADQPNAEVIRLKERKG
jgi:integrase